MLFSQKKLFLKTFFKSQITDRGSQSNLDSLWKFSRDIWVCARLKNTSNFKSRSQIALDNWPSKNNNDDKQRKKKEKNLLHLNLQSKNILHFNDMINQHLKWIVKKKQEDKHRRCCTLCIRVQREKIKSWLSCCPKTTSFEGHDTKKT